MEFTTCLELHSQATRLWGKLPPAERRPPYGPVTLFGNEAVFQRTWARSASARRRTSQTPHSPPPSRAGGSALSSSQFARRYYGNPLWFHFLRSMICLNSAGNLTQPEVEMEKEFERGWAPGSSPSEAAPTPPPPPQLRFSPGTPPFDAGGRPPNEHQTAPHAGTAAGIGLRERRRKERAVGGRQLASPEFSRKPASRPKRPRRGRVGRRRPVDNRLSARGLRPARQASIGFVRPSGGYGPDPRARAAICVRHVAVS